VIAYQCHGSNVGPMGHLRKGNGGLTGGVPFVAFDRTRGTSSGDIAGPLRKCGARTNGVNDAKADTQCVAFQPRYARNGRGAPDTVAAPLTAEAGRTGKGDSAQCVAYTVHGEHSTAMTGNGDARVAFETQRARSLDSCGGYATNQGGNIVRSSWGVRRLTPTECERLQGFPDDWTLVDGTSDSARYRQLGNAVAVPCAEWIGRRIVAVPIS